MPPPEVLVDEPVEVGLRYAEFAGHDFYAPVTRQIFVDHALEVIKFV